MSSDDYSHSHSQTRAEKERIRAQMKESLLEDGFPPEHVERAIDCWGALLGNVPVMLEQLKADSKVGFWTQYGFFQGFCAGVHSAAHLN